MYSEEEFIKDRNEAFSSGDINKIREYCKKYEVEIPENEEIFLAGINKSICNLFLLEDSPINIQQYNESYDWLIEHGYSPSITKGEEGEEGEEDD